MRSGVFLLCCMALATVITKKYWQPIPENVKTYVSRSVIKSALSEKFNPRETMLHFIWISPGLSDSEYYSKQGMKKARLYADLCVRIAASGHFKLTVWTDLMVKTEFPELVPVLERISVASWISDILRYHIILRYGGVYFDTDERMLRDFTPLLHKFDFNFTVCEDPWIAPGTVTLSAPCKKMANGIIAAQAGNPAVRCAAELSLSNSKWAKWLRLPHFDVDWTGPPLWSSCVRKHGHMNVLPSWTFLPCYFYSRSVCRHRNYTQYPLVFGVQEWAFSWGS